MTFASRRQAFLDAAAPPPPEEDDAVATLITQGDLQRFLRLIDLLADPAATKALAVEAQASLAKMLAWVRACMRLHLVCRLALFDLAVRISS